MNAVEPGADRLTVERWAGEVRVNLVRLAALLAFYGYHLLDVYLSRGDPTYTPDYRTAVAAVALGWAILISLTHTWLRDGRLRPALPYGTALADVALVTALVAVSGGPRSPLVLLYLPAVAATPLRLSLRLVAVTTAAAALGYLTLLGLEVARAGVEAYYADPARRVPRPQQVVTLLTLLTTGLLAGQAVRQARRLAAVPPGEGTP